jgi:hypothetical protein
MSIRASALGLCVFMALACTKKEEPPPSFFGHGAGNQPTKGKVGASHCQAGLLHLRF